MTNQVQEKIVITRAKGQAEEFAHVITAKIDGVEQGDIVYEPLLEIVENRDIKMPYLGNYSCVLVSSVHGCNILPKNEEEYSPQFYCVGVATANVLIAKGYRPGIVVQNARDLLDAVSARHSGSHEKMLYLRGRDISVDMKTSLRMVGHSLDEVEVYRVELAERFDMTFLLALKEKKIGLVTFFSRRTAKHFAKMVDDLGIAHAITGINALCMSDAVVECLHSAFNENILVADTPDMMGMVNALKQYVDNQ
ncbi:MAG: uroporphyrinogen-III synthase [Alphaproteobacteria bacterium]